MSTVAKIRKFGTAPVFFTAISTILGAMLFLRFGWSVGNVGLAGTIMIILLGHAVTIPTAMAIAEIATNQKVEGGGEYFIISRSFGLVIGSSIGIALYLSQAISVALYIIAFAESFNTLFEYLQNNYELHPILDWLISKKQTVSIPALILLTVIVLWKGADLGVKTLYVVVVTLFLSMLAFFIGDTGYSATNELNVFDKTGDFSFFVVFAVIFPAFTGMTAGVGLSGDLKNPSRSIPLGTLAGTIIGMIIYIFIAFKLWSSASLESLANMDNLIMADIAWQGWWIIPLGLAAATISSALGSIMVAPRTLQAIAKDRLFPTIGANYWLSRGKGRNDEPYNATVITVLIALAFILIGNLNFVAAIISMFFMVTYGSLCLISFLSHFAADPAYRPSFKSKWYISLFGALACFGLMFFMNPGYAILAIIMMTLFYVILSRYNPDKKNMAVIFQGAIFQLSRQLQVFLQKAEKEKNLNWRPSVVCISKSSFERLGAFDLLRWIAHKYGFGTYIHKINGYLSKSTNKEAKEAKNRLIKLSESSKSNIYIDTLISPSYTSAIAQVIQLPGISGTENNLLLLEFSKDNPEEVNDIIDNYNLIRSVSFDVAILATSIRGFGIKKEIHIWITQNDYDNANLMILLAYILLGHKEWSSAVIKIFAIFPSENIEKEEKKLFELITTGKLPISSKNIKVIPRSIDKDSKTIIKEYSKDADLTIIGIHGEALKHEGASVLTGCEHIGNTLYVNSNSAKTISR